MKLILKLAWRNIWRNKRRSILTLLAVTFAVIASIAMRGIQEGTYELNIKNAVEMFSGYLQIQEKGYLNNPSLAKSFKPTEDLKSTLSNVHGIKAYSTRINADGLISFKDNSLGCAIFGLNPQSSQETSRIFSKLNEGRFFTELESYEIVIGYKLLKNLKADIGDEIVILAQGFDGSLGNMKFKIVGTTKMGMQDFDAMSVFMDTKSAQELLSLYGRITALAIDINSFDDLYDIKEEIKANLKNEELVVLDWKELMPDFEQSIQLDNISGIFFLAILFVIVAFGILNTVLMSVTERFKEFGISLSIGMSNYKLVLVVLLETLFITIIGLILGNIIGFGINLYIFNNPIQFGSEYAWMYEEYGFLPRIEASLKFSVFFNSSISILIASVVAAVYPIIKVIRLEPLKGIRYT
ncbi:MAG: ABC transporter permease [Melioribacteraceae bacterium]|nr:ABC transporter permease [Melioribacteraceae bacterium]